MSKLKAVHHIGIATKDLESSILLYRDILGFELLGIDRVESEEVQVAAFKVGELKLELLAPLSENSSLSRFMQRYGEGLHHIAFDTDNIQEVLSDLRERGLRLINPEPKQGAFGVWIAFVHPKSTNGVLIELCQSFDETERDYR